jgi:uncharacterized protein YdeI (YjbR/CyaY-like superfamily)
MKQSPNESNTLYVSDREVWRQWLQENYQSVTEIWLIYPRQHSGKRRIVYNDAVEEALCFGWIDSNTHTIDEDHYSQRFTLRKPRSGYSQTNIERLRRLLSQGKVLPEVLAALGDLLEQAFEFPPDIEATLQANEKAWANFQTYSGAYQRIRVAYVEARRGKPEGFAKRLSHLLKMTEQNKQFGFGIEAYY